MNAIIDRFPLAGTRSGARSLPETLRSFGAALIVTDSIGAALTIALCGLIFHAAIAAFFTTAAIVFVSAATGRYRISFTVTARDEWYAAGGVALLGTIIGLILTAAFGFSLLAASVAGMVWALAAGVLAVRLHRIRRGDAVYEGCISRLRSVPRQPIWALEQALIRALDVVFAALGAVLLAPVLLFAAVAVVVEDGGPALFGQRRVGRDERDFTMFKVRTMRVGADGTWVSQPGDARVTRIGSALRRSSLDELPQLLNVLRGEMSLVGPRPEMLEYAARFGRQVENYWQRHRIRPGITGWAQLYLPRTLTPDDAPAVLGRDLFYVEYGGLYLYLQCLMKTALEIFRHRAL